ncbi:MAG: mycothiol transferase [Actinomycetes bacterium]
MTGAELLADAFGRVHDIVHDVVDGLSIDQLSVRIAPDANTIGWLIWHLARVQDDHVAHVADREQVWTSGGWAERFSLPFDVDAIGYGQSTEEVGQVRVSAEMLVAYFDAVHEQTLRYVETLRDADFDRVVDERWDPPVTLGARLVSVLADDLQHCGQAAYARGVVTS